MSGWMPFLLMILITILMHEFAHMISALILGVKVKAFSIGFGKPLLHKKIKGIDFRFTPLLIGGYVQLKGENSKVKDGFLAQPYWKKVIILSSGVIINFLIACLIYWINYHSLRTGIKMDLILMKVIITKQSIIPDIIYLASKGINLYLVQMSLINLCCALGNILPFPGLDGGHLWIVWLQKLFPFKKFVKIRNFICGYGVLILIIAQILVVWYIWS